MYKSRIKTDLRNRLIVNGEGKSGRRVTSDGTWSLTPEHDLKFHVTYSDDPDIAGRTLIFYGEIENARGNALRFRVRDHESIPGVRTGSITLRGRWQADRNNRITFNVAKARGRYDTLTFDGAWLVNRNNELTYKYVKTSLKTKIREEHIVVFRGQWNIGKNRLVYRLERSFNSFFVFKAEFLSGKLSVLDRVIKFKVGTHFLQKKVRRGVKKVVTLYGGWDIKKGLKVTFSIAYSGGRRGRIEFGAEKLIGTGDKVKLSLTSNKGETLGVELDITKKFKNDAELFLALSRTGNESRVIGGFKIRF
ncbi:MAG: hypothetical protein KJ995_06785 [Candidatus Omnitrophica bacterium]|nr:hypothetical protein [Candidatus Omnitrophota bacterium]MBU1128922.1 hypothetical protein [Candidatus Omnitrophota bacterium]MBU1656809.1 hypothetical protein [Candidatus Omnitrophota bacterium]MBU1784916.1 hypothetical protein [Candidatus Omnitrophota bacterium]MBU1852088.1 hypothetical protein [Candidatus Omnitrophota bacterium]